MGAFPLLPPRTGFRRSGVISFPTVPVLGKRLDRSGADTAHSKGCLLLPVPDPLRKELTDWTLEHVLDEHLGPGGRELAPHVTVLYGFPPDFADLDGLLAHVRAFGPFALTLGGLSLFRQDYGKWDEGDGDVLKLEVASDALHELHHELKQVFGVETKYPEYQPHLTLAYLQPEAADLYLDEDNPFAGRAVTAGALEYSAPDKTRTTLPLSLVPRELLGGYGVKSSGGNPGNMTPVGIDPKDIPPLAVKLIDGFAFRNIDPDHMEFCGWGIRQEFAEIPEGEVWIDERLGDIDRKFAATNASACAYAFAQGLRDDEAWDYGLAVERAARQLAPPGTEHGQGYRPLHGEVFAGVYLSDTPWKELEGDGEKVSVWIVDGLLVRSTLRTEFSQGGHAFVYPWIPENEIWVEEQVADAEREFVLLHEFTERRLMKHEEMGYGAAHEAANRAEFAARQAALHRHAGESGEKLYKESKDKAGHRVCTEDGVRVECRGNETPAPQPAGNAAKPPQELPTTEKPAQEPPEAGAERPGTNNAKETASGEGKESARNAPVDVKQAKAEAETTIAEVSEHQFSPEQAQAETNWQTEYIDWVGQDPTRKPGKEQAPLVARFLSGLVVLGGAAAAKAVGSGLKLLASVFVDPDEFKTNYASALEHFDEMGPGEEGSALNSSLAKLVAGLFGEVGVEVLGMVAKKRAAKKRAKQEAAAPKDEAKKPTPADKVPVEKPKTTKAPVKPKAKTPKAEPETAKPVELPKEETTPEALREWVGKQPSSGPQADWDEAKMSPEDVARWDAAFENYETESSVPEPPGYTQRHPDWKERQAKEQKRKERDEQVRRESQQTAGPTPPQVTPTQGPTPPPPPKKPETAQTLRPNADLDEVFGKALSWLGSGSGGDLVKPPAPGPKLKDLRDHYRAKGVGSWLARRWTALESRYGRKRALILALAQLAPVPLLGTALIAAAELERGLRGYANDPEVLKAAEGKSLVGRTKDAPPGSAAPGQVVQSWIVNNCTVRKVVAEVALPRDDYDAAAVRYRWLVRRPGKPPEVYGSEREALRATTKSLTAATKAAPKAGTCKQGERSDLTGCTPASGEAGTPAPKAKPPAKKPPAKAKRAAPGSQLADEHKAKLRELGMVGTFPPADVPLADIKFADLSGDPEDLKYKPLMSWSQTTHTGRVSRQYRYTQAFHDRNAAEKFERVLAVEPHLTGALDTLRAVMADKKMSEKERDAAAIASVIAETGLRPTDGDESVKHGHFGIASLQARHLKVVGDEIHLDFVGKEGVRNQTVIHDPANVTYLKAKLAGRSGTEAVWSAGSDDAGAALKKVVADAGGPDDVKLKDLRTIKATQTARTVVGEFDGPPPPLSGDEAKDAKAIAKAILAMSGSVAKVLNNTPTMARDNYIHPKVFQEWLSKLQAS